MTRATGPSPPQFTFDELDLLAVLRAVIGHGYCEQRHPAGQDLVSKDAIAQVRAILARLQGQ